MINTELKTRLEVLRIKNACTPVWRLFKNLDRFLKPGMSIEELRNYCAKFLISNGASPALRGFNGFPEDICISVNNVAAHGVNRSGDLHAGDIVSIDVTTEKDGWHGDGAWTFCVGPSKPANRRLIKAAWQATYAGIQALHAGGYLAEVGIAVEKKALEFGCHVLPNFVGHGIGRNIHEDPKVIHTSMAQLPVPVVPGLVITVEPIITFGDVKTSLLEDGWSQITADGSLTAQFEHTIAVFSDHVEVLTIEEESLISLDFPPYV